MCLCVTPRYLILCETWKPKLIQESNLCPRRGITVKQGTIRTRLRLKQSLERWSLSRIKSEPHMAGTRWGRMGRWDLVRLPEAITLRSFLLWGIGCLKLWDIETFKTKKCAQRYKDCFTRKEWKEKWREKWRWGGGNGGREEGRKEVKPEDRRS